MPDAHNEPYSDNGWLDRVLSGKGYGVHYILSWANNQPQEKDRSEGRTVTFDECLQVLAQAYSSSAQVYGY